MADGRSIVVFHPTSYRDSRPIGERFRDGDVVLCDLSWLEPDEAHRLVDFVAGLVFGLGGNIDKVTTHVLVLAPPGVTVLDDAEHLTGSFYNQS
ncbi:cell division protein SepF [Propioniciclava soli]|uniref:Cell division protein SepF n=1 Tax=Propioniciclava soli TaxID=2775081 RepID=A0ABZ3C8Q9_9ACTN